MKKSIILLIAAAILVIGVAATATWIIINKGTGGKPVSINQKEGYKTEGIKENGSSNMSETQNNNKDLTPDEALNIAKKLFRENWVYRYEKKAKINGVDYYQFTWGDGHGDCDSFICIDVKTGKAYVQYFDWKTFEDYETWAMNSALGRARLFGNNMEYKFLKKVNINGVEYYQFSWGSNGAENDSRICVDIKKGKAYLLYPDGRFIDYETWANQTGN